MVPFLALAGQTRGDDATRAAPPIESRVGQTVTVIEAQHPTDKAVITQVWRLADGSPVMQAKSLSTGWQLTLVENLKATGAAQRIKVYHWTKDGVAPAGCPIPPTVAKPTMVIPTAMAKLDKVATTEGGLLPVLSKPEQSKSITTVAATKPAATAAVAPSRAALTAPPKANVVATTLKPAQPTAIKTVQATAPAQTVVITQVAPMPAARPQLIGGCEVITINENGKPRQFKVVGTARDRDGVMLQRCEALDNGQIVTLSCGDCSTKTVCAAPCPPVTCAPVVAKPCPPAPCPPVARVTPCAPKCEPKCEPVKCIPCPPVACAPKCEPCVKPCPTTCTPCEDKCAQCGGKGCDECRGHRVHADKWQRKHEHEHVLKNMTLINVPVPGVPLGTAGGMPSGLPPQPLVPSFCTANSSSVRAAICGPVLIPMHCVGLPFSPCLRANIMMGIDLCQDGIEAEAVKNTLFLMNVLQTSREWENRAWAAERLQMATLPSMKPYVEDCLMAAVQCDAAADVKASALRALVQLKPMRPDLMGMLAQSLRDPSPVVQQAAAQGIECLMKGAAVQQAGYQK